MNLPRVAPLNDRSPVLPTRTTGWRLLIALILLAGALMPMAPRFAAPAAAQAPSTDLVPAVQAVAGRATGAPADAVIVEIVEEIDAWAFGTAVVPAGDSDTPVVKFFLAHREASGEWTVALRFTDGFTALLALAPPTFPSAELRGTLEGIFSIAADDGAQLSFPFPQGETWYFQGPHMGPPHTSLDFSAGVFAVDDPVGTVVAMRGGTVYRPCAGMVMIDHGDGWATGYYHVEPIIVTDGQVVARGQQIGLTSKNWECGGYASSNHVHVWTEYHGVQMPIHGQVIGGWTVEESTGDYLGCLVRGTERRCRDTSSEWTHYVTNEGDIGTGGQAAVDIVGAAGTVGESLDYTLTAFPANAAVSIIWKRPGGSTVDLGPVTTDATGAYAGQLKIPATTNGDANTVTFTSGANSRTVRITVHPRVTATPLPAAPGGTLNIKVSGYPKQQVVTVMLTPEFGDSLPLGSLTTTNTGNGSLAVTLPAELPTGQATLQASAPVDVVAVVDLMILGGPTIQAPTTGQRVGAPFSYSLAGFPASAAVTVEVRNASTGIVVVTLPGITTDASGNAAGSGAWPLAPAGQYRIVATTNGASAERLVTLNPALVTPQGTVQRGASISVTAQGMAPGSAVTFSWLTDPAPVTLGSAQADANGTATAQVTVPAVPDSTISLSATVAQGGTAFGALEVAGGPMPGPASASVSPVRSTVNNWVTFSIANFPANSAVQVKWIRTSGSSIDVATVQTDSTGAASGQVRVPATPGGMNGIRFVSGSTTATVPFEVVARIKVTPAVTERGGTVDVSLRGYGKQEVVRIRWKQGNSWVQVAQVTTSNTGSANISVTVPDSIPDGASSVRGDGTSFRAQTNAVTISGGITLTFAGASTTTDLTAAATPVAIDRSALPTTDPLPVVNAVDHTGAQPILAVYDGDSSTVWQSDPASGTATLTIDIGQSVTLGTIAWLEMQEGCGAIERIEASVDGGAWIVLSQISPVPAGAPGVWQVLTTSGDARYVRWVVGNVEGEPQLGCLAEVAIWGTPVAAPAPTETVTETPVETPEAAPTEAVPPAETVEAETPPAEAPTETVPAETPAEPTVTVETTDTADAEEETESGI